MANCKLSAPSVEVVSDGKGYVKEPSVSHYFRKLMISVERYVRKRPSW